MRQETGNENRRRRMSAVGTAAMALCAAVSAALIAYAANGTPLVAVVQGSSMEPGYVQGDASACVPGWSEGDAVVLRDPERDRILVKRLVAAGPCAVGWDSGGRLSVDGNALDEPYARYGTGADQGACDVPDGYVFVLGDNRGVSHDSRAFGPVPEGLVLGRLCGPVVHVRAADNDDEGGGGDAAQ